MSPLKNSLHDHGSLKHREHKKHRNRAFLLFGDVSSGAADGESAANGSFVSEVRLSVPSVLPIV